MITATMEKKRLGLISKACVVIPKHLTIQMASEWMRLYPNAKLLVARPENFTKDMERPTDSTGHSISVSDVFTVKDRAFYVDRFGFQLLPDFMNLNPSALEMEKPKAKKPKL